MDNQYRSILKATSIFGGTQVLQILVGLLRSKLVAVLIGTTGMGLNSMYMSSLTMFITIFGFGMNMSVVKDLSKAYDRQDRIEYARISKTFKHLLLLFGVLGSLCVICLSYPLSNWTFNTGEHTVDYCFLSLVVCFTLFAQGNTALLVSSRRIKETAKCSLISSFVSLIIAVPFFYFFRLDGIVPGLVLSTIGNYVVSYLYARRVQVDNVAVSFTEHVTIGKNLISLGVVMVLGGLMANLTYYLTNLFITKLGGLSDLGLYGAGFSITVQTVSMVFASMGSDYFPRLSAAMGDRDRMNQTINEQSEIVLLLAVPILAVFMLLSPIIIRFLLSEEFLPITGFVRILCFGMMLRAASYALGYITFAKGDKRVYFLLEGVYANLVNLALSVLFYYLWGLTGMAWSFVVNYMLYYSLIRFVDTKRYGYQASKSVNRLILLSVLLMCVLLAISYLLPKVWYYSIGCVATLLLCVIYLKSLNDNTGLINSIICRIKK
jgi:O-antigen/teichoic acid export membrane protein